jgi:hypothetical protein
MVIAIVALAMLTGIIIRSMELRAKKPDGDKDAENRQLRQQLADVRQRMKVLERIVTDRGVETAAQIEALRERDTLEDGDKVE